MKICYWNIKKDNGAIIIKYIIDLLVNNELDLLLISEYENINKEDLITKIGKYSYILVECNLCKKVLVLVKREYELAIPTEDKRYIILQFNKINMTIVGLHLESDYQINNELKRVKTMNRLCESLNDLNNKYDDIVLVGDFNCLPTARELSDKEGIYCCLFKEELKRINDKNVFYNPIYLLLNEKNQIYGSFRYISNDYSIIWYPFDQVIVSKKLIDRIVNISYLKQIGSNTIVSKNGIPSVSDHLPIYFEIVI